MITSNRATTKHLRRPVFGILVFALSLIGLRDVAYACAAIRGKVQLSTVIRHCPEGSILPAETDTLLVTGTVTLVNRRSTPTLGNLGVEIDARSGKTYVQVARLAQDAAGHSVVETCGGTLTTGPLQGEIALVDAAGQRVSFDQMKHLPDGAMALHFVARFDGPISQLRPGGRVLVKVMATAFDTDSMHTCSVDADGDGVTDHAVTTLLFSKKVRVPVTRSLLFEDPATCNPPGLCNDGSDDRPSAQCDDGNVCNGAEICAHGVCAAGPALGCDDDNPCTEDTCDPERGCQHRVVPNGTACADANVCNGVETCSNGVCAPGTPLDCDSGNPCETSSCDPLRGCQDHPGADGASCDDGDVCNGTGRCTESVCMVSPAPCCDDHNACTIDSCDAVLGCQHTPIPRCIPCRGDAQCDDGNACDGVEACVRGSCATVAPPPSCADDNPCTDDTCDPVAGCKHARVADGAPCGTGPVCNALATCQVGVCTLKPACDDDKDCTQDSCNMRTGLCEHARAAAGSTCTDRDGDSCTTPACNESGVCEQRYTVNAHHCPMTNCVLGYPFASSNPRTSVIFNENEMLRAFRPQGGVTASPGLTIKLWYNDEHAMVLGVRQVKVKTTAGISTKNYAVSPLTASPASVLDPQVGATALDGEQSGTDTSACAGAPDLCDRPMFPALFITDITNHPDSKAGDWQYGGTPIPPSAVFGSWKAAVRVVDKTRSPAAITVTPDGDPVKNNWALAGGDLPPAGLSNEGYGAEVRWNVDDLIAAGKVLRGHSYRLQFMVHDGDQQCKVRSDVGQNCANITFP